MAKKYGLSYSDESTADSIGRVSSASLYDTTKGRVTFVAEFEDIRPDEAFSRTDYDGEVHGENFYEYGPMVGFIKKFIITIKDPIKDSFGNYVKSFKINEFELKSGQYTVTESGTDIDKVYIIEHDRPPLRSYTDDLNQHGVTYIDPTDSDPNKFKYFLFDPVEIEIRSKYSREFINSLSSDAIQKLRNRIPKMQAKGYPDFEYDEIEPVKLYDYWLTERVEYLFRYKQVGSPGDSDYAYFPAPFHNYQVHLPGNIDIPNLSQSTTVTGTIKAEMLQQMRFASYYSQHKEGSISAGDMERMFGTGWDLGGGNLDLVSWDGVALEPITTKSGVPAGYKDPKGKYVKLEGSSRTAPICYGCNRHPTWMCPVENGTELLPDDDTFVKWCEDLDPPQSVISTPGPLEIKDIPRVRPKITIEDTGYMSGIGNKPDFPTTIKREFFDRFFLLFSNVHQEADPLMYQHMYGSARIVPERSDIRNLLNTNQLGGHTEICPRRAVERSQRSSYIEKDGTKLSDIAFDVDKDGESESRYPYSFRAVKNYRDQFRSVYTDLWWDKLNIAKIYTQPSFPVKLQTKRAYTSLDYIRSARIFIVQETFFPESTSTPPEIYTAGGPPGERSRKCCRYVNPAPSLDCRCNTMEEHFYSNELTQPDVVRHYFAVFSNSPVSDYVIKYFNWMGFGNPWSMRTRPEDLPGGARVRVPVGRTIIRVNNKAPIYEHPCSPGGITGRRGGGQYSQNKKVYVPLDDMNPDDAQDLLDDLLINAEDHPCFTRPQVNLSHDIIVGYKRVEYPGSGITIPGGYFQWLGTALMVPTFWCAELLAPGADVVGESQSYETAFQPGVAPGLTVSESDRNDYVEVRAAGSWYNTLANVRENPTGWFNYTFYCDHFFWFIDGEFKNCRCR